ncbi:MAG: phosphopantothenoylcysteine decarboxylase/phosphopantothenate--cysteine ligase [Cyclobacteriaceae bacterium]|jgi:phosphopantothenoylcysteine decarboxylase/phosphopantothenate--cysteine ligase
MLEGKKIIIAVCGSIAAYKTAFFIRLLVKAKADVRVIMTDDAKSFISPITLGTLSKNPVKSSFKKNEEGEWNNHVEMGLWADLIVVAPATANTIAKFAHGLCDNLVTAVYLSARCPVMISPAMDLDMYQHPSTKHNLSLLTAFGNQIIAAEDGELASGLNGVGRLAEPAHIIDAIEAHFKKANDFEGQLVLITSGPTHEAIDPVRFIGNHSTGKMGKSLAYELAERGAKIIFISGPVAHYPDHKNIEVIKIKSALEMYEASQRVFPQVNISIFAAAVADYRPSAVSNTKIKKKESHLDIQLIPNPDIAKELGLLKTVNQLNIGFALETDAEEVNALGKLKKKNLDMIVLNSLQTPGAGFAYDTNKVSVYDKDNNTTHFELKSKTEVAKDLVDLIARKL